MDFYFYPWLSLCPAGQRNRLTQEAELWESVLEKVGGELSSSWRAELIRRSSEMMKLFRQLHLRPMASFVTAPVPADFNRSDFYEFLFVCLL